MSSQTVVVVTVLLGAVLLLAAALLPTDFKTQFEAAINLGGAALGFALAVFGAVKSIFGVTELFGATRDDVTPAGVTAAAGALLMLASAIP